MLIQYKKFKFQHILHFYMPRVCVNLLCVHVRVCMCGFVASHVPDSLLFCKFLDNGKSLIFTLQALNIINYITHTLSLSTKLI